MTSEDMEASMMNKEHRRLEILKVSDAIQAEECLRMLMGTGVNERREFLFNNVDFSKLNA